MSAAPLNVAADPSRPVEIEGLSNRLFIHQVSRWLVPHLQRLGVHPNVVSLTGMAFGLCAVPMFYYLPHPIGALGLLLCFLLWLICDGADGKLARATGTASPTGRVIDGIADYSVFVFYYTVLAFSAEPARGVIILWLAAAAGASHIAQAASFEAERERYQRWTAKNIETTSSPISDETKAIPPFPLTLLEGGYLWLQRRLEGGMPDRASISLPPGVVAEIYRRHFTTLAQNWGVISANSHVAAVFLFALAGVPEGYFLFEIIVFNGALIVLLAVRRNNARKFNLSLADATQNSGEFQD